MTRATKTGPEKTTAERILDAAEARFAARGFEATSLGDVAADVEIRAPSLYKHFTSKRDLYIAVVKRLLAPYSELLEGLLRVPENADDAERNLEAVMRHFVRTPNLARLVQHAALAGGEDLELLVQHWYEPLFRRATDLSRSVRKANVARRPEEALGLVIAFHSMMSGYVTMAPLHARLSGRDPLGTQAVEEQIALLRRMSHALASPSPTSPKSGRKKDA